MNKHSTIGVLVVFVGVFLLSVCALANDVSLKFQPDKPDKYSCDTFRKDVVIDETLAIKKALSIIDENLYYIADIAAFDLYKNTLNNSPMGLKMTLEFHRDLVKDVYWINKWIMRDMEEKGPVKQLLYLCNLRKDSSMENIASAYSATVAKLKYKESNDK